MKTSRILLLFLSGIFLISFVNAAITVDGDWQDGSPNIEITEGESALFNVEFYSYGSGNLPMILNIKLYDSNDDLVYAFEDETSYGNGDFFYKTYTINTQGVEGSYEIIAPGNYKVIVIGIDNLGSSDTLEPSLTLKVNPTEEPEPEPDTTAPVIQILSPTEGITYNAPVEYFNFIATDTNLDICSYSVDDGVTIIPVSCTSGILTVVDLTSVEGTNTWTVYAQDDAGNPAEASVTFTVDTTVEDTTSPTINIISPEAIEYDSDTITFEIVIDEDTNVVEMSLNGATSISMINSTDHVFTYTLTDIADGTHTVVFYVEDTSSNTAEQSVTFTIDTSTDSDDDEEDDDKTSTGTTNLNHITNEYDEEAYLAQFEPKTIYLDDEEVEEELSWFQKFIEWLKRLFGLK